MTIPKGQIGNDREIKVVTERWVSNDLQMTIKSSNSDPRFGDTTYQLTGIVEREPDASLFQIPPGYTDLAPVVPAGLGVAPGGRTGDQPSGRGPGVPGRRGGRGEHYTPSREIISELCEPCDRNMRGTVVPHVLYFSASARWAMQTKTAAEPPAPIDNIESKQSKDPEEDLDRLDTKEVEK
jgi:hypothetical protein